MWKSLLILLTVQAATGAPTLGDELTANFQNNMAVVHGNIMAGITNIMKPVLDMVDKVPNAILGEDNDDPENSKNFVSSLILDGAKAFNSGIKLSSTLIASPFKLAGDGLTALETVLLGRNMDLSSQTKKKKRDLSQMSLEQLFENGLKSLKEVLNKKGNLRYLSTKQKRQSKSRLLEGLTETMDLINDYIAEKVNVNGQLLILLAHLIALN